MSQNETRGTPMAKVQKSFMLNEDLDRLVRALEERSGSNFTRIMHAALMAYLCDSFYDLEEGRSNAPDVVWMRLAVLVDRGEIELGDIPITLLDSIVESCDLMLRGDVDEESDITKRHRKRIKDAKKAKRVWEADIEEFGGKIEALIEALGHVYKKS